MKIKSKKNIKKASGGYKVPHLTNGAFNNTVPGANENASNLSQNWGNANTDTQTRQNQTSTQVQNSQANTNINQAFSALQSSNGSSLSSNPKTDMSGYLSSSISGAASSIPGSLAYGTNGTPMIGGSSKAIKDANNFRKASTSTGTKVGRGIGVAALNFIPIVGPLLSQYGSVLADKMVAKRQENLDEKAKNSLQGNYGQYSFNPREEVLGANPQMAAFGGSLEHYNLPQHKELPQDLANTQMDGKGVQLEKNETMLKFPDGKNKTNQDYSFSPNLGFNKKGVPTINEKEVKQTFADASKKIESKKTFGFDRANQNSQKYAFNKLIEVAEATREAKEGNPNMQLANGGVNKYGDSGFNNKWNLPQLKKGTIGAPKIIGASNFKQTIETPQINAWDFYSPENGKTKNKIVNDKVGMSTGDKIQLAGSVAAPLTNLAMFLANKSEKVKENLDNTQYSDPRVAKNYNPLYLAENAAKQSINDNSTSDAVRRANLIGLSSNMAGKAQDYSLGVDSFNSNAMLQRDNMMAGTNRFNAQARTQRDDLQAQNDARRRAFLTTGASQAGQTITEAGKASNASDMNNIYGNILKNYSPDYSMDKDGNITFKKKANGGTLKMKKKK